MGSNRSTFTRRHLLSLAGGTLGTVAVGTVRVPFIDSNPPYEGTPGGPQPATPETLALLGGIEPGTRIGPWQVAAVYDVHCGAIPVVLKTSNGEHFQVDILKHDSKSARNGIASTRHLTFFLANRGDGRTATDERQGVGVMALARAISLRESSEEPERLLTHRERASRHPAGEYTALV